jgi:hypothetical protein
MLSDAAKYLCVVLLAGHFGTTTRPPLHPEYQNPLGWFDLARKQFEVTIVTLNPAVQKATRGLKLSGLGS